MKVMEAQELDRRYLQVDETGTVFFRLQSLIRLGLPNILAYRVGCGADSTQKDSTNEVAAAIPQVRDPYSDFDECAPSHVE